MEDDRRFLRFLWWPAGDTSLKPRVHAMKVHLFGGKSSPSVVNYCIRKIAEDNVEKFSELAIDTLRRAFYMDDMIKSVSLVKEARDLVSEMQALFQAGGFELSKFISTSRDVIESVEESKRAKSLQNMNIHDSTLPQESTLGLGWNVQGDFLTYSVNLEEKPLTKRGLLATTASLYDPLGLVAPVLLVPKLMQQELCRQELDWDDAIPEAISKKFCKWRDETVALSNLQIRRCFQDGPSRESDRELHIFTDASEIAYGAAAYLKVTTETGVHVSLMMDKSRVAPLKAISIPRLELTAATVGAKLSRFILDELDVDDISVHFWTESMTVLRYLRNVATRFKIFVAHRVQQIQDVSDVNAWNYVPSEKNPADLPSRGISPIEDDKLKFWLGGPQFLRENTEYTRLFEEPINAQSDLEVRCTCATEVLADADDIIHRYSSARKLKKAVVWLKKFYKYKRGRNVETEISVKEIESAWMALIKFVQGQTFQKEIKDITHQRAVAATSPLKTLNPVLINWVLRVGGRLENADSVEKNPIILPNQYFTRLEIQDVHEQNAHVGSNQVMSKLREKYYILKGYSQVKAVLSKCIECRKQHAKPEEQLMAKLPKERVDVDKPPFAYVGWITLSQCK